MSDGGKGSAPRPTNHEAFSQAWERIFGAKPSEEQQQQYQEQQKEESNGRKTSL